MSSDQAFLALRLVGPLQSWGYDSQFNRRNTGLVPTKSAIAGMICAAHGYSRGSQAEKDFLTLFFHTRMLTISIPLVSTRKSRQLPVQRLEDYHTVQNSRKAEVKGDNIKDCHITRRQYLVDASFGVLIEGEIDLISKAAGALANPVWGIWLGRKCCLPSAPILAGLRDTRADALRLLIGDHLLESYTRQEEIDIFSDGQDSIPDMPISFSTENRSFSPRRIRLLFGAQ